MNVVDKVKQEIRDLIGEEVEIEIPKNSNFGDFSTNFAMKQAKSLGKNPREIAQDIIGKLKLPSTYVEKAEIAGAGFINFYLKESWINEIPKNVLDQKENYGQNDSLKGKKINLEYVSANPTGPMHMGNARGGALGDSLAKLFKLCGASVTKEFYLNDTGNQIVKFGESLYARYMQKSDSSYPFPEDGYQGQDVIANVDKYLEKHGDKDITQEKLTDFALENNIADIKRILKEYNVDFDVWFSEKTLHNSGAVEKTIEILTKNGHTYEKDGAIWLRTQVEEKDDVIVRANGIPTYFAADIAYHYDKLAIRGFDRSIDIWGADHHGHIARVKKGIELMGLDPNRFEVITVQLVRLVDNDEIVRQSKRRGNATSLGELIEDIGVDAARFFFNTRLANTHFDFDLGLAIKKSNDNPVFYVQYAYARICSILNNLEEVESFDVVNASEPAEKELLKKISCFPNEVALAADNLEAARIVHYATDLAGEFHSFYSACKVAVDDDNTRKSRIAICQATKQTLKNVLDILGVSAPEKM